jgi:hypothetical protein
VPLRAIIFLSKVDAPAFLIALFIAATALVEKSQAMTRAPGLASSKGNTLEPVPQPTSRTVTPLVCMSMGNSAVRYRLALKKGAVS